jgi:hypothetical protein
MESIGWLLPFRAFNPALLGIANQQLLRTPGKSLMRILNAEGAEPRGEGDGVTIKYAFFPDSLA